MAASDEAAADLLDVERIRFIRETAQLLYIRSRDAGGAAIPATVAWQRARDLWTDKPEDC